MPDEIAAAYRRTQENMPGIMGAEEIDTDYTRQLVCPYCGHVETDSWEIAAGGGDGDVGTTNCGECGREYEYTINVDITYSSNKMED